VGGSAYPGMLSVSSGRRAIYERDWGKGAWEEDRDFIEE
jgi:hypothetical protein